MDLTLRVACSQSNSQRAEEARQLLKTTPGFSSLSLIQRIAASSGDSQRAEEARQLLKTMPEYPNTPTHSLTLIQRIALNDGNSQRAEEAQRLLASLPEYSDTTGHCCRIADSRASPPGPLPDTVDHPEKPNLPTRIRPTNGNATIRVQTDDSSGGVDIELEVPVGLVMTIAAADGG
jgi:hypothetical protein